MLTPPLFRLYKLAQIAFDALLQTPQFGPGNPDFFCKIFQMVEDVIKENKESCLGLFQSQALLFAKAYEDRGMLLPECMKVYLQKEDEEVDLEEEDTEFPTFNKLIQELVMIQKLLSKKA